jgi:hypothetical protein
MMLCTKVFDHAPSRQPTPVSSLDLTMSTSGGRGSRTLQSAAPAHAGGRGVDEDAEAVFGLRTLLRMAADSRTSNHSPWGMRCASSPRERAADTAAHKRPAQEEDPRRAGRRSAPPTGYSLAAPADGAWHAKRAQREPASQSLRDAHREHETNRRLPASSFSPAEGRDAAGLERGRERSRPHSSAGSSRRPATPLMHDARQDRSCRAAKRMAQALSDASNDSTDWSLVSAPVPPSQTKERGGGDRGSRTRDPGSTRPSGAASLHGREPGQGTGQGTGQRRGDESRSWAAGTGKALQRDAHTTAPRTIPSPGRTPSLSPVYLDSGAGVGLSDTATSGLVTRKRGAERRCGAKTPVVASQPVLLADFGGRGQATMVEAERTPGLYSQQSFMY